MLITLIVCVVFLAIVVGVFIVMNKTLQLKLREYADQNAQLEQSFLAIQEKNKSLLSQKTSQSVRMGEISENLLPLLSGLPYDPRNLHHLAKPIDFIYFSYDGTEGPEITFVEVKSGGARESTRQKLIQKIIKEGKIHYDLVQINEKGIKVTRKI